MNVSQGGDPGGQGWDIVLKSDFTLALPEFKKIFTLYEENMLMY